MSVDEWKVNKGATKKWGTVLKTSEGELGRATRARSIPTKITSSGINIARQTKVNVDRTLPLRKYKTLSSSTSTSAVLTPSLYASTAFSALSPLILTRVCKCHTAHNASPPNPIDSPIATHPRLYSFPKRQCSDSVRLLLWHVLVPVSVELSSVGSIFTAME